MSKSVAFFSGYDTYARPVQVAFRADGVAFFRYSRRTQWGVSMCKWRRWDEKDKPDLQTALAKGFLSWGFKTLMGGPCDGFRLPADEAAQ